MKKTFLHILSRTVWTIVGLYAVLMVAIHIPSVQTFIAGNIKNALVDKLDTRVEIGRVDLGFLNRVIVDGLDVYDKHHKLMLHTSRVSAKIDIIDLISGKINITSAQIFGLNANLYKNTEKDPFNFQFVIDSLKSKDTTSHKPLNLHIASLVIRNGSVKYDLNYIPAKHEGLDVNHLNINKISTHCMLYELTDDKIDLYVKNLSLKEKSGLQIERLTAHVGKDKDKWKLSDFNIALPHSSLNIPEIKAQLPTENGKLQTKGLELYSNIVCDRLTPSDIQAVLPINVCNLPAITGKLNVTSEGDNARIKVNVAALDNSLNLSGKGYCNGYLSDNPTWGFETMSLFVGSSLLSKISNDISIPSQVMALGDVSLKGQAYGTKSSVSVDTKITTSQCGQLSLKGNYNGTKAEAHLNTSDLNLGGILANNNFGKVSADLDAQATIAKGKLSSVSMKGTIGQFDFRNYGYQNINIDGKYDNGTVVGKLNVDDPNANLSADVNASLQSTLKQLQADIDIMNMSPGRLNITDKLGNAAVGGHMTADLKGSNIDNLLGSVNIRNLYVHGLKDKEGNADDIDIDNILLSSTKDGGHRNISLRSDDADLTLKGDFTPSHLSDTFIYMLKQQLPSLPGISLKNSQISNIAIDGSIRSTILARKLLGIDVDLHEPLSIDGYINGHTQEANLYLIAPSIDAFNHHLEDVQFLLWTPDGTMRSTLAMQLRDADKTPITMNVEAMADDDIISSTMSWDNHKPKGFKGNVNIKSRLATTADGSTRAVISISPSNIEVGDSVWKLHSRDIVYSNKRLYIDHFAFENDNQHVYVNGVASSQASDSLMAELKNVDVSYILNLVNFHSVEFGGYASGNFTGLSLFSHPEVHGHLDVSNFMFQYGRMGNLHANIALNNTKKQLDVDAYADENGIKVLDINGMVSPQRKEIDLDITSTGERMEFVHSWCDSFMSDLDVYGNGRVRLFGPFSNINLDGKMVVDGAVTVSSLNCRYQLRGDTITFVPDDITLSRQPIYDKYGNVAYFSGGLHHHHLTRMTYDFDIDAHNFLSYDFHDFGESTFYGTAFMTGKCKITGRSSELTFDVDGDVESGSGLVYNASSPDAITRQEFINWGSADNYIAKNVNTNGISDVDDDDHDVRTNIHMNFLVNVTPGSTLRMLMDRNTGDYIDLNGSGVLRANYYNKGGLDVFGNYLIDHGIYKMTIQNVIRRDFDFMQGGSISFSGDPYSAILNMKAKYTLNSVSLSDLNIGNSFSSNNIKVDCLMDITGTPGSPVVNFNLDPHTNNTEARQMIFSLINSEEELNQQVLYLLSVGRFYAQGNNNALAQENRLDQTTLAMQSIVSGTLSQQFNNMLSRMVKNNNWNFGANISPGDEGFYNAEYEGLLNGSLLNNRLLFNGQFGYRDKATTANQEFIGDFDLRYLLFPNGNFAVRVYNQTNDRYFTKNSLNTQGIGLILKKDFNSFWDLFRRKK